MCYNIFMFVVGGRVLKQKRHKRKSTYTVMIIANRADGKARHFRMSHIVLPVVACALLCVVIICSAYSMEYKYWYNRSTEQTEMEDTSEAYQLLKEEYSLVLSENESLQQQVSVLSSAVNSKDEKLEAVDAENTAKSTPTGFPLDGTASIEFYGILEKTEADQQEEGNEQTDGQPIDPEREQTDIEQEDTENTEEQKEAVDEYIVVFSAGSGTSVIAAGTGVISSVTEDPDYGYRVVIDHGNGYVSIYRNSSAPKVKEGSDIARGTIIFELSENQKVGYQIMLEDEFVDPMDMMEIYG